MIFNLVTSGLPTFLFPRIFFSKVGKGLWCGGGFMLSRVQEGEGLWFLTKFWSLLTSSDGDFSSACSEASFLLAFPAAWPYRNSWPVRSL